MDLHVRVLTGRNLPALDADKSDPYIRIFINGRTQVERTKAIPNSVAPIWNEEFHFDVLCYGYDILTVKVFDEDVISDDEIGKISIQLALLPPGEVAHSWYPLAGTPKSDARPEIELELQVAPKGTPPFTPAPFQPLEIKLTVVEAKELAKMDTIGKSDPYVIAQLQHSPAPFRTKPKDNTLTPVWNESTVFPITAPDVDILNVKVLDQDIARDDDMATAAIPLAKFADGAPHDEWFTLTPAARVAVGGQIHIKAQIVPRQPFTPAAIAPGNLGVVKKK